MAKRHPHQRPASPRTALPFRVRTLGRVEPRERYHSTLGTYHDDAMLTVCLSGAGRYLHRGVAAPVGPGTVGLVLPVGDPGILMTDPDDPYDHLYCRFAGGEALRIAHRVVARRDGRRFFTHPAWQDVSQVLLRALTWGRIHSTVRQGDRMTRPDAALAEALTLLDAPEPSAVPALTAERLRAYIDDHLADPADLAAAAAFFGVSKPHLCRVAKKQLGTTLQRAWQAAKMDWARVLLAEPSLSIGEVARRVGYRDPFYFSNVFKRQVGQSPTGYRRARLRAIHSPA